MPEDTSATEWERFSDQARQYVRAAFGFECSAITFTLGSLGQMGPLPLAPPARAPAPPPQPHQQAQAAQTEEPKAAAPPAKAAEQYSLEPYATETYELVTWGGKKYTFSKSQRQVVKCLWEAWQRGRPEVEARTLLNASGTSATNAKLSNLFPNKEATGFGTLIVKVGHGTCYRLAFYSPGDPDPEVDEE